MTSKNILSKFFTTDDGVQLHYLESSPKTSNQRLLVLLPGWSQTSQQFQPQVHYFATQQRGYHVVALDPRGHGDSDKPEHGYQLSRMAQDLLNLLDHLAKVSKGAEAITLLGHSASCAVIWTFMELFGQDRIHSLILIDQMAAGFRRPGWTDEECKLYGARRTKEELFSFIHSLEVGPNVEEVNRTFLKGMFLDNFSDEQFNHIFAESQKFPRPYAAEMIRDVLSGDFRDIIPTIKVPTLCVGGAESRFRDAITWIASQIPQAELRVLPGSHFMFVENPDVFNKAVDKFLAQEKLQTSQS